MTSSSKMLLMVRYCLISSVCCQYLYIQHHHIHPHRALRFLIPLFAPQSLASPHQPQPLELYRILPLAHASLINIVFVHPVRVWASGHLRSIRIEISPHHPSHRSLTRMLVPQLCGCSLISWEGMPDANLSLLRVIPLVLMLRTVTNVSTVNSCIFLYNSGC